MNSFVRLSILCSVLGSSLVGCSGKNAENPAPHEDLYPYLISDADSRKRIESYNKWSETSWDDCDLNDNYDRLHLLNSLLKFEETILKKIAARANARNDEGSAEGTIGVDPSAGYKKLNSLIYYTPKPQENVSTGAEATEVENQPDSDAVEYYWSRVEDVVTALDAPGGDRYLVPENLGWVQFYVSEAKRLASNDYWRVVAEWDFYTTEESVVHLVRMQKILKTLKSSDELVRAVEGEGLEFKLYWQKSQGFQWIEYYADSSSLYKQKNFDSFKRNVDAWVRLRYGWVTTSNELKDKKKLNIYMDAGEYSGGESQIVDWFSKTWIAISDSIELGIVWVDDDLTNRLNTLNLFPVNMIYTHDFTTTPYVSPGKTENKIVLPIGFRLTSFEHEMGHVLGLPDEYYTLWDSEKCRYRQYSSRANIMANSTLGKVLPKHGKRLKEIYGIED